MNSRAMVSFSPHVALALASILDVHFMLIQMIQTMIFHIQPPLDIFVHIFYIILANSELRSGQSRLRLCNHIERKHIFVDVVGRVEPVARSILGCDITDALRYRRVDV